MLYTVDESTRMKDYPEGMIGRRGMYIYIYVYVEQREVWWNIVWQSRFLPAWTLRGLVYRINSHLLAELPLDHLAEPWAAEAAELLQKQLQVQLNSVLNSAEGGESPKGSW